MEQLHNKMEQLRNYVTSGERMLKPPNCISIGEDPEEPDLRMLETRWECTFPLTPEWAKDNGVRRLPSSVTAELLRVPDDGKLLAIVLPTFRLYEPDRCRLTLRLEFHDEDAYSRIKAWRDHLEDVSLYLRN